MNAGALLTSSEVQAILPPVLAMMLLVLIVWLVMFATRFKAIGAEKIPADELATPDLVQQRLPLYAMKPAHNFKNLFEVPTLFIALCFYLYLTGTADSTHVTCAWVFVAFRYLHSFIQCGYNNVNHRFMAYAISCLALWVMLIRAIVGAI